MLTGICLNFSSILEKQPHFVAINSVDDIRKSFAKVDDPIWHDLHQRLEEMSTMTAFKSSWTDVQLVQQFLSVGLIPVRMKSINPLEMIIWVLRVSI